MVKILIKLFLIISCKRYANSDMVYLHAVGLHLWSPLEMASGKGKAHIAIRNHRVINRGFPVPDCQYSRTIGWYEIVVFMSYILFLSSFRDHHWIFDKPNRNMYITGHRCIRWTCLYFIANYSRMTTDYLMRKTHGADVRKWRESCNIETMQIWLQQRDKQRSYICNGISHPIDWNEGLWVCL